MLELVKMLLGIDSTDTSKDKVLDHYITQANKMALLYCNVAALVGYDDTVAELTVYLYKNRDSKGYTQKTEGEKSIAFELGIPESIKAVLPVPKITVGVADV
ncbi:phage head-tail connector protein [Caproiciproducens faecalis]|uniref:Phage head-tail connector protein n=1 Tax=Caproiciproducens faecalis TaxID=2820301 RepID=A0ABS7DMY3_9FIRM|nr:phage head-tail connector protein [Caproiciproducens faecalis]MBW7572432.1 phage head-tail connector protein [Caproiciproducens faecalis]